MEGRHEQDSATADGQTSASFLIDEALMFYYPAALRAVAATGVADHLADGPRTVEDLARRTGVNPQSLYRALRVSATRGIFEELDDGRFRLTPAGDALRTDAPLSARSAVLMLTDQSMWRPAGEMERCLQQGGPAFDDIFGMPFFDHFAQDQATAAVFHHGMAAMSAQENAPIAAACEFPDSGVVVDVGGGQGGLLLAVLGRRDGLRGVLFDAEHVLRDHLLDVAETGGRWELAVGDFFTEVPKGDVYLLKRILHDWEDDQCVTILRNCHTAMRPGGRILVIDAVVPPGNAPHQAKLVDLLLMASLVGRERTAQEFSQLFEAAGLRLSRVVPTGTVLSVVEATPKDPDG
ncbi:methyltransferase [Streptosporangium sp. NPDC001559]|uniref:methyltransferase n=1 Tax=Streptosporangium sp. NPDC001559 TaxID=3366187 RepID=UPI0036E4522B